MNITAEVVVTEKKNNSDREKQKPDRHTIGRENKRFLNTSCLQTNFSSNFHKTESLFEQKRAYGPANRKSFAAAVLTSNKSLGSAFPRRIVMPYVMSSRHCAGSAWGFTNSAEAVAS